MSLLGKPNAIGPWWGYRDDGTAYHIDVIHIYDDGEYYAASAGEGAVEFAPIVPPARSSFDDPWLLQPTREGWWWWARKTSPRAAPIQVFGGPKNGLYCFPTQTGMHRPCSTLGGLWAPCNCPPPFGPDGDPLKEPAKT